MALDTYKSLFTKRTWMCTLTLVLTALAAIIWMPVSDSIISIEQIPVIRDIHSRHARIESSLSSPPLSPLLSKPPPPPVIDEDVYADENDTDYLHTIYKSFFKGLDGVKLANNVSTCHFPPYEDVKEAVNVTHLRNRDPSNQKMNEWRGYLFSRTDFEINEKNEPVYHVIVNVSQLARIYFSMKPVTADEQVLLKNGSFKLALGWAQVQWLAKVADDDWIEDVFEISAHSLSTSIHLRLKINGNSSRVIVRAQVSDPTNMGALLRRDTTENEHHVAIPKKYLNGTEWKRQKERYTSIYGHTDGNANGHAPLKSPNVMILILDSVSRANFHRQAFETKLSLNRAMHRESYPSFVYQFLRMSSIGWGTGINLGGFFHSCFGRECPGKVAKGELQWMHEFYAAYGYLVYGTNWQNDPSIVERGDGVPFWTLQENDFKSHRPGKTMIEREIGYLRDVHRYSSEYDEGVPFLVSMHIEDMHSVNQQGLYKNDLFLKMLVEDEKLLKNTILYIVADHGDYIGVETVIRGWESHNPLSLLFLPKEYFGTSDKSELRANLMKNEQKLVTHWDVNVMFHEYPLLFTGSQWDWEVNRPIWREGQERYLPEIAAKIRDVRSPMTRVMEWERKCTECVDSKANSPWVTFCMCWVPVNMELTDERIRQDAVIVKTAIEAVNEWTRGGLISNDHRGIVNPFCVRLNWTDFKIVTHSQLADKVTLSIENRYVDRYLAYRVNWNLKRREIVKVSHYGRQIPHIERLDLFSKEPCLKMISIDEFGMPVPISLPVDMHTMEMHSQHNFRWCRCK